MPGSDSQQRQSGRRLDFAFMEGDTQTSVPSTGAPTLYFYRFVASASSDNLTASSENANAPVWPAPMIFLTHRRLEDIGRDRR